MTTSAVYCENQLFSVIVTASDILYRLFVSMKLLRQGALDESRG